VNEARRFPALADIWVKKSGANLGQTSFAMIFVKVKLEKERSVRLYFQRHIAHLSAINTRCYRVNNSNYLEGKQKKSSDFKKKSELMGWVMGLINQGSHQCLHWCQPYATGIWHFRSSSPITTKVETKKPSRLGRLSLFWGG